MSNAFIQHQARLMQHAATRKTDKPTGNYEHAEHQWGVIAAVNVGPPASVDVYLNATAADPTATPSPGISYLPSYVPTVGDVVLIYRGSARNRSDRVVLGKMAGAASPYPLPLGNIDPASRRWVQGPGALWGGEGIPSIALGNDGDFYFRTDTPVIVGQQLYVKSNGEWTEILSALQGVTQLLAGDNVTLDPEDGIGEVTVTAVVPVTSLIAGDNVTLDPEDGVGDVTISVEEAGFNGTWTGAVLDLEATTSAFIQSTGFDGVEIADAYTGGVGGGVTILSTDSGILLQTTGAPGVTTTPQGDTDSVTTTFGQVVIGTAIQNTTGYDLLVTIVIPVTAAAGGYLTKGVQDFSNPGQVAASPTFAAATTVTLTSWVPNDYYLLITAQGTITCGTPVTTADPL